MQLTGVHAVLEGNRVRRFVEADADSDRISVFECRCADRFSPTNNVGIPKAHVVRVQNVPDVRDVTAWTRVDLLHANDADVVAVDDFVGEKCIRERLRTRCGDVNGTVTLSEKPTDV